MKGRWLCCITLVTVAFAAQNAPAAECRSLYGVHDADPDPTEYLNQIKAATGCGWVTATVAVGHNPADTSGANFSSLAGQGHTIICRINNGYFPNGTIPLVSDYDNFALRCSNFVISSTGCNLWVIGNECNLSGEWPSNGVKFAYVSPQNYASCFRKVYKAIKAARPNDKVLPQPPAPFAGPYGTGTLNGIPADGNPLNWVQYLNQTLTAIQSSGPLDGIALHITSRGYAYADIHSTSQVNAGGQSLYFSFNVYKDWVDYGIPHSLYNLPLYATECNGYYYWKGGHPENPAAHYQPGWMQEIYAEIDRYNQSAIAAGKPFYHCVNMYRWCATCDGWNIDGADNPYRAQILSDLDAAAAQNYIWPISTAGRVSLIATGSVWKYLDDGSDQMTMWRGTNFDDSTWASGRARLGYGDGGEATVVNGGPTNNHYITTYFRRSFLVTNLSAFTNVTVRLLRDDGGAVYLNGVEIFRSNMPAAPAILFDTLAFSSVPAGDKTTNFYARSISPSLLVNGTNVLAVEVHQVSTNSPGMSFDLELIGLGNALPAIRLTGPTNGAVLGTRANLPLNALASDDDGQVRRVEFCLGSLKLGEDTNSPFSLNWTNPPEGSYTLTAVATDNGGGRSTSAPVTITLFAGLISTGTVWRYLDNGANLQTAWRGTSFDDSGWASGPAQFGYGDGDEATVVNAGPTNNHFITTYFRRRFIVSNPSSFTNSLLRVLRDDGAVVYLNGKEVFRSNMTNGTILFNTLAASTVGGNDESTFFPTNVNPTLLLEGTNLVAVEIHQVSPTSSDISFDLEWLGLRPPPPPVLSLQRSGNAVLLAWSAFAQGFRLEAASSLGPADWSAVTNAVAVTNTRNSITLGLTNGGGFYRLRN